MHGNARCSRRLARPGLLRRRCAVAGVVRDGTHRWVAYWVARSAPIPEHGGTTSHPTAAQLAATVSSPARAMQPCVIARQHWDTEGCGAVHLAHMRDHCAARSHAKPSTRELPACWLGAGPAKAHGQSHGSDQVPVVAPCSARAAESTSQAASASIAIIAGPTIRPGSSNRDHHETSNHDGEVGARGVVRRQQCRHTCGMR